MNPYSAGFGNRPPHLAGRKREIHTIQSALDKIKGGKGEMDHAPNSLNVLVGPRGVGKTVLLKHSVRQARERGIQVASVYSELLAGDEHTLINEMFPPNWFWGFFKKIGSLKIFQVGVGLRITKSKLRSALQKHLAKKPLLMVMDEAHTCESEALKIFFDSAQECISSDLPLAVVIAGTPGLVPYLRRCKATYVERSEIMRFNTLSQEEARDALEVPAREAGRPIQKAALGLMLDWSDNYPFFVQMVGKLVWNASEARGGKEITIDDAKEGLAVAEVDRKSFYEERYNEIFDVNVLEQAHQVADLVGSEGTRFDRVGLATRLAEITDGMDTTQAVRKVDTLLDIGYVWNNVDVIEPGIPPLFDYVKRKRSGA